MSGLPVLKQDFDADFDAITAGLLPGYSGPPYAFSRYADGEAAIIAGRRHVAKSDQWEWPAGQQGRFAAHLMAALRCQHEGWIVGVTAEEHHPAEHHELLDHFDEWGNEKLQPWLMERLTFAELFIFGNYQRFKSLDLSHCLKVGPRVRQEQFRIPVGAVNVLASSRKYWDWSPIVDSLIESRGRPIIVSAGPIAKCLIHDYWRRCPPDCRQVIIDVGSAMDEQLHGKRTRAYQRHWDQRYSWKPKWKLDKPAGEGDCGERGGMSDHSGLWRV